jgi:exopolysaccharide biosynthesis WecB/TagA/CpsF family protein
MTAESSLLALSAARDLAPARFRLDRDALAVIGDLLPIADFALVLAAAELAAWACAQFFGPLALDAIGLTRVALAAALLAPFILCDRAVAAFIEGRGFGELLRCHVARLLVYGGAVAAIGWAAGLLTTVPPAWPLLWLAATALLTAAARIALWRTLLRLRRTRRLVESVALLGAGPAADQAVRELVARRGDAVEILGVFDDRASRFEGSALRPSGSVADLVDLGKSRSVDWIVMTLPATADARVARLLHRLKSLSAPVGLCAASVPAPAAPSLLEELVPRWVLTLLGLPSALLRELRAARRGRALSLKVDACDEALFADIAARYGSSRFGYVVTANADHIVRLHGDTAFRALYADASFTLLDSRFVAHVLRVTRGARVPVCTGSDLTAMLLDEIARPHDPIVLIGATEAQAQQLRERYGLEHLAHYNPPMGFVRDEDEIERCLSFIEAASPFRFCLLAVGSPQQELLAQRLKQRGVARGLAFCIGASIDFLTGAERRAPRVLQRLGLEWAFRLLQAPRRLAYRYLVRGPRLFGLLRNTHLELRDAFAASLVPHSGADPDESSISIARTESDVARAHPQSTLVDPAPRATAEPALEDSSWPQYSSRSYCG